jgi:hypothetical protein
MSLKYDARRHLNPQQWLAHSEVASVLASQVYDLLKTPEQQADPNAAYYSELHQLTADSWRASGSK